MKKMLFLLPLLLGSGFINLMAQDVIVKRDGAEISATVTEITDTEIKYKVPDRSVVYTIGKSDVFMIKYANGTKDVFAETAAAPAYSPEQAYTPPHAASTRTWVFGSQTWSDAIQLPECNKMSFTDDYTVPHCRSYTGGGNTWYYYNWAFVLQYEPLLCPAPWRVPARADLRALQADAATLISQWGYGGYARGGGVRTWDSAGYYWSSQQFVSSTAYILKFHARRVINGGLAEVKYHGYQVRCVK